MIASRQYLHFFSRQQKQYLVFNFSRTWTRKRNVSTMAFQFKQLIQSLRVICGFRCLKNYNFSFCFFSIKQHTKQNKHWEAFDMFISKREDVISIRYSEHACMVHTVWNSLIWYSPCAHCVTGFVVQWAQGLFPFYNILIPLHRYCLIDILTGDSFLFYREF